jgi:hypothetical protein
MDNSKKPCYIGIDRSGMVVAMAGCVPNNGYDAREIAEALTEMADQGLRVELTTVEDGAARLYQAATEATP